MDKFKDLVPKMNFPKNLKNIRNWNASHTFETFGNNVSQLVNRFVYPKINKNEKHNTTTLGNEQHFPQGVSTISGTFVSESNLAAVAQKDNFGLYALKHDRNAALIRKGLMLNIPLKLHTKNKNGSNSNINTLQKEINHEKFQSCENRLKVLDREMSSSLDESIESVNNCQEVNFEIESDIESSHKILFKPFVPPRRRRKLQSNVTQQIQNQDKFNQSNKNIEVQSKNTETSISLSSFIVQNNPENDSGRIPGCHSRNKSIDIFSTEQNNVFKEFDLIFNDVLSKANEAKDDDQCNKKLATENVKKHPTKIKQNKSVSTSLSESSHEEINSVLMAKQERRFSSTIKVQNFNEQNIPRCKSIISPKHQINNKPLANDSIGLESSINKLKSPALVANSVKKAPQGILKQKPPIAISENSSKVDHIPKTTSSSKQIERRFFVYYNDEDELVFNQQYKDNCAENDQKCYIISKTNLSPQKLSLFTSSNKSYQRHDNNFNYSAFNHNEAMYKNYYNSEQNDSLRSMASSCDGIFI
uniref:CSON002929 protein n=1 Tax=Culicoides sonorensis TaxID=179676 RepID=A0A336LJA9_CULSO